MKSLLLFLCILFLSGHVLSQEKELTFSYWSEASPPFIFFSAGQNDSIAKGILIELGELIALNLKVFPKFIQLPVQRIESKLNAGEVDMDCITNSIWKETPEEYFWSPPLFKASDRFLVKSSKEHALTKFEDLSGKSLGVYNGYTYHSKIMSMIKSGEINAVKVSDIDHGIQLLLLDRIDALIDFDILLDYKIKTEYSGQLALADLYAESYDLYCAYSKKISIDKVQIDQVFEDLISSGQIESLLKQYN